MGLDVRQLVIVGAVAGAVALAALAPSCGGDGPIVRVADLTGSQEVPPVTTTGSGFAKFKIARDGSQIRYQLSVEDLPGVLFAHIHVGAPGVNGPIIFNLATAPFTEIEGDLTAADLAPAPAQGIVDFADAIAAIESGATYANAHTAQNPGGEVRGQIE
jgi:CHRD domain